MKSGKIFIPNSIELSERKTELKETEQFSKNEDPRHVEPHLMTIFSFLHMEEKVRVASVSNSWNEASKKSTPLHFKPEFLQELKSSNVPAGLFYFQHIEARLDTFYLVGNRIDVQCNTNLTKFNLRPAEQKNLAAFSNKKDAIAFADSSFNMMDGFPNKPDEQLKKYPAIYTVQVNNIKAIESKIYLFEMFLTGQAKQVTGFSISLENIHKIYEVSYKAGKSFIGAAGLPNCKLYDAKVSPKDSEELLKGTFVKNCFSGLCKRR